MLSTRRRCACPVWILLACAVVLSCKTDDAAQVREPTPKTVSPPVRVIRPITVSEKFTVTPPGEELSDLMVVTGNGSARVVRNTGSTGLYLSTERYRELASHILDNALLPEIPSGTYRIEFHFPDGVTRTYGLSVADALDFFEKMSLFMLEGDFGTEAVRVFDDYIARLKR